MAKKAIAKKVYQYTAIFEPDDESGGYAVTIPSLPGCISEGDSFEKALENIKEAASLYLAVRREKRKGIIREERGVVIAPVQVRV